MATQQNNGGRIYTSKPAETTYQGAARSIGFNPVKAANSEKAMKQYKAAIIADGETMSRELLRQQQAENTALAAQQKSDASGMRLEQLGESSELKMDQLYDRNVLDQDHAYKKGVMALEMSHLKASHSVANARTKVIGSAIQGLLSFGGSVLKYSQQMDAIEKQQEAEQAEQMKTDALNGAFFGDNFFEPTEAEVEETDAVGDVINSGVQAEATALGDSAAELRSTGVPLDKYEAEQLESMSTWNNLASIRGNVHEAKMMYPAFLAEAKANGLIRPGAQGMQDIQNLNRKFADATGITAAAAANPKFVADNFTRAANGIAMNTLTSIASEGAAEIKAAREAKVASNIAANFAGLSPHSSMAEVGAAFDAANRETVNGQYGGRMSAASTFATTKAVAKELADAGRTSELLKLKSHAPNPNTPNLTLGKQYGDLLDKEILRSRQQARTQYNLGKGELNMQAEQIVNDYWRNPSPENLRRVEAQLRTINTDSSRRLADKLVQNGYDYDPSVARDIAAKRGTAQEYSLQEIQDLGSKGIISSSELKQAIKSAPDAKVQAQIKEAIKTYKPGKGLTNNVVAGESGKIFPYQTKYASPAFKQELKIKEARFNIELSKRLQGILRDNSNLDVTSQEFQDIVTKESEYLMKQDRFQITYKSGQGYSFGEDTTVQSDYLEKVTIAPGKQTFYGRTATDIFKTARISKAMVDPTVDQILTPEEIEADSKAILDGGKVSKRTNDWAHALGMSQKDFVNSQRLEKGLPNVDQLRQEVYASSDQVSYYKGASPDGDIKDHREGMRALRALGMPLRGAAYMSSAIKHESNWHGTRQWGEVAGDGTNRNGGLLSWASWAGNSARLGNIERYFGGRNIAQISEQEQLQFLMHELKTSYPRQYDVFMDPGASKDDLRWATWEYIKWDKRYTGNRWTVAESLIRWGSANP